MTCKFCNFDLCFQCEEPREDELNAEGTAYRCCCDGLGYRPQSLSLADTFMANRSDDDDAEPMGLPRKARADMKDPISTGRKEAARLFPIPTGKLCDWAGLARAGGGVEPIVGCVGNPALHIHHGPDKNTLNNEYGVNLHHVCTYCHNRWHAKNNKYYGERPPADKPFIPITGDPSFMHDGVTEATAEQVIENERQWQMRPENRGLTNVEQSDTVFVEANGEANDEPAVTRQDHAENESVDSTW